MKKVTLVLWGWGIEFGRYYCGGAPERVEYHGHGPEVIPAVPLSWSWGFGVHYRTHWHKNDKNVPPTKKRPWIWARRWWYGKEHDVRTVAERILAKTYLDDVAELMNREWNQ